MNNQIKILASLLAALLLILISLFAYYIIAYKKGEEQEKIVFENGKQMQSFSLNSTVENKEKYIEATNEQLANENLGARERDLLLLRKALNLAVLRGGPNQESQVTEATQILNDFIKKYRGSTSTDEIYIRDYAIVGQAKLHLQCCFQATFLAEGFPEYSKYDVYTKELGYSENLSELLVLNDLLKSSSKAVVENDVSNIAERLALTRVILGGYAKRGLIKKEMSDALAKEVEIMLGNFRSAKPLTYNDSFNTKAEPEYQYAASYGTYVLYKSNGSPSPQENIDIDRVYSEAFSTLNKLESETSDKIAIKSVHYYLFLPFLMSVDARYDKEKAEGMLSEQIDTLIKNVRSAPGVQTQLLSYLKAGIGPDGKVLTNANGIILSTANKYKKLKDFFSELGLVYSTQ